MLKWTAHTVDLMDFEIVINTGVRQYVGNSPVCKIFFLNLAITLVLVSQSVLIGSAGRSAISVALLLVY